MKKSRSLPANVLAISRIQRILSEFPLETRKTILEFVLKSAEEEAQPCDAADGPESLPKGQWAISEPVLVRRQAVTVQD